MPIFRAFKNLALKFLTLIFHTPSQILLPKKKLEFEIIKNTTVGDYDIYWKVLNRGDEAKRRDQTRGQIIKGCKTHVEHTQFRGKHLVECYIVQNNVVVARDIIDVPIAEEMK